MLLAKWVREQVKIIKSKLTPQDPEKEKLIYEWEERFDEKNVDNVLWTERDSEMDVGIGRKKEGQRSLLNIFC